MTPGMPPPPQPTLALAEAEVGVGVENALSVIWSGDSPGGDNELAELGGNAGGPNIAVENEASGDLEEQEEEAAQQLGQLGAVNSAVVDTVFGK